MASDSIQNQWSRLGEDQTLRVLRFRSSLITQLRKATTELEFAQRACDIAVSMAGYKMAWVGFAENDALKTVRPFCHSGSEAGFLTAQPFHWGNLEQDQNLAGAAIRQHRAIYKNNLTLLSETQRGFQSAIALPLLFDETHFGVFQLYDDFQSDYNFEDIGVLLEAAKDLAESIIGVRKRNYLTHELEESLYRKDRMVEARTRLIECTLAKGYDTFLATALDEISETLGSPIAFFHLVEPDQQTLSLQGWSTRTVKEFCTALGKGLHYPISKAGVWADCARNGKAIVHNDYMSLPHRKGLPEGHAPVLREMVVPIFRADKVVSILGVGNKPVPYTDRDVETLTYLADVLYELHEKQFASDALETNRQFTENLLQTIPFPMNIVDKEGRLLFASVGLKKILGRDPTGESCWTTYKDNGQPCDNCPLKNPSDSGETQSLECSGVFGGRTVEIFHTKITFSGKEAMLEIFQDITERKLMDAKIIQSDRLVGIGMMAAGIAHEINTPLGIMKLFLGQLKKELNTAPDLDRMNEMVDKVDKTTDRIAKIVRGVKMLSRDGSKDPMTLMSIKEIIEDVASVLRERFRDHSLDFRINEIDSTILINCRAVEVAQVVLNLLANAHDAIENLNEKWVEIGVERVKDRVMVTITDSGTGIPKAIADKMFDPFYTTKGMGKGTGIGLSISSQIVLTHGGHLSINPNCPNTQFVIDFPEGFPT